MTTPSTTDPPPWLRRWAAERLGVSADAPPAEARTALLRRLPTAEFVPPPDWKAAAEILQGQPPAPPAEVAARAAEAERLREAIETFAGQFWDLPPEERKPRWLELYDRSAGFPAAADRMLGLESALDVHPVPPDEDSRLMAELAYLIQELAVTPSAERAARRRELLRRMEQAVDAWQVAEYDLRQLRPDIVALDPELGQRLRNWGEKLVDRHH
jgi:hypothetical protein